MATTTMDRLTRPLRRFRGEPETVWRRRPWLPIGGLLGLGLLLFVGIWLYPEARRTWHIKRM